MAFKFDISQSIRDFETLLKVSTALGANLEQTLANAGRLGVALGQSAGMASTSSGVPAGLTSTFSSAASDHQKITEAQFLQAQEISRMVQSGSLEVVTAGGRQSYRHVGLPNQTKFISSVTPEQVESRLKDYPAQQQRAAFEQNQLRAGAGAAMDIRSAISSAQDSAPRLSAFGAGIRESDIPRVMQEQAGTKKGLEGIENTLRDLRRSDDKNKQQIANSLDRLVDKFAGLSDKFQKSVEAYENTSKLDVADPKRVMAETARANAAGELRSAIDQIKDLQSMTGDGGGTRGMGGWRGRMQGAMPWVGAAAGIAMAGTSAYLSADKSIETAVIGAERQSLIYSGQAKTQAFQTYMESMSTNNAENLIKYHGDTLFGKEWAKNNPYLGRGGFGRAVGRAANETAMGREIEATVQTQGYMGAAGQVFGGAMTAAGGIAAGGTGLGALLGGAVAGHGVDQMLSGVGSGVGSYYGSNYSVWKGRLNDSAIANFIMSERAKTESGFAQGKEIWKDTASIAAKAREMQEAALANNPQLAPTLQRFLDTKAAERQAVSMIGTGTVTRDELMRITMGQQQAAVAAYQEEISDPKYSDRLGADPNPFPGRSGRTPFPGRLRRIIRGAVLPAAPTFAPSMFEELGISPSEAIMRHAQLSNALNMRTAASEGEKAQQLRSTGEMIKLGRAGLGGFDQLLGNLTGIQSVTGGTDEGSMNRLKEIFSSSVAAGFDKSRTAQSFIQNTTALAQSINTRDLKAMSGMLATSASLSANVMGGRATEADLRSAAIGIQTLEQITSGGTGLLGVNKAMGIARAGGSAVDISAYTGLGADTAAIHMGQLDKIGISAATFDRMADAGTIDEPLRRRINAVRVRLKGRGLSDKDAFAGAVAEVRKFTGAAQSGIYETIRMQSGAMNVDSEALIKSVSVAYQKEGKMGSATRAAYDAAVFQISEIGGQTPETAETLVGAGFASQNKLKYQAGQKLGGMIAGGQSIYKSFADTQMTRYLDEVMYSQGGNINAAASKSEYLQYIMSGGRQIARSGAAPSADDVTSALRGGKGAAGAREKLAKYFGMSAGDIDFGSAEGLFKSVGEKGAVGLTGGPSKLDLAQASRLPEGAVPSSVNIAGFSEGAISAIVAGIEKVQQKPGNIGIPAPKSEPGTTP